jgi:DNA modification methylase
MSAVMNQEINDLFALYNADCVEVARTIPENSIDFSVFSPPFESLYVYSNIDRDMGNSRSTEEFWAHYKFLIAEQLRIQKPGRLVAIHCMNIPTSKVKDGYIGLRDFRGEIRRAYEDAGFIFHSEVVIWKDPVMQMQRTKALGLLHKQVLKDSAMSRQGLPDYLVVMRKPGINPDPIGGPFEQFIGDGLDVSREAYERQAAQARAEGIEPWSFETWRSTAVWQRYASPVWMDINASRTLQYMSAREEDDERHIAPLQLDVIERAIELWTNPGDVVFSPFTGIGSEGYCAIEMGRRFIGAELKRSYFETARRNLLQAVAEVNTQPVSLFDLEDVQDVAEANLHAQVQNEPVRWFRIYDKPELAESGKWVIKEKDTQTGKEKEHEFNCKEDAELYYYALCGGPIAAKFPSAA